MRQRCAHSLLLAFFLLPLSPRSAAGQVFDEKFEHWPVETHIQGRIIVCGRLQDTTHLRDAVPLSARRKAVMVVDPEASPELVARLRDIFDTPANGEAPSPEVSPAPSDTSTNGEKPATPDDVPGTAPSTLPDESPDAERRCILRQSLEKVERLDKLLASADTLLWYSAEPIHRARLETLWNQREALKAHLDRGGTLVFAGEAAECVGRFFTTDASANPSETSGLNLLPDCVLETSYEDKDRSRLLSILAAHPRTVGIGLADDTILTLDRRRLTVTGPGNATLMLMANTRDPVRLEAIAQRGRGGASPTDWLADLTEWRRDAIDRTLPPFPPAEPPVPHVEHGTLVIVGGGRMPEGLMARFVEMAGGPEKARMVYVPCSEADELPERQATVEAWKRLGVKHATFIHTKDRHKANTDEEFLAPLKDATGLWFGGGRQWNFADSYYGTRAHKLMKDVLKRGGVIGGSSAGASIQARYLARATPIGNWRIMAPGYERGGLGFLSGVAIDQHFTQRNRQKDMTRLADRYPQLLGIGIDEATALIVRKSVAEVVGRGQVYFYDRRLPVDPDRPDHLALPAGSSYNLAERQVIVDASQDASRSANE